MSEEEDDDVFSKIEEIQKKHNNLLEENNRQMKMFGQRMGVSIGFGGYRHSMLWDQTINLSLRYYKNRKT